jgi:hypothetical protein
MKGEATELKPCGIAALAYTLFITRCPGNRPHEASRVAIYEKIAQSASFLIAQQQIGHAHTQDNAREGSTSPVLDADL